MFFRALKRSFWVFYDNLFKGVFLNFILFGFLFGVFVLVFMKLKQYEMTAVYLNLIWHIIAPAVMYYWILTLKNEDTDGFFAVLLEGIKKYTPKSLMFFLLNGVFFVTAFISINFYKEMGDAGAWAYILGGIGLWLVLMFFLMQIYLLPIFIMDEKKRFFVTYKKALIMVLSAPFSSLMIFLVFLFFNLFGYVFLHFGGAHPSSMLALISLFPIFLMPFITYSFICAMQVNAVMLIYEKHNVMPDLSERWENKGPGNIFKPWEMKK
ncbi:MAG: hypothetical protein ACLFP1_05755 [Candidatus Goldiibacteriota bacterium]